MGPFWPPKTGRCSPVGKPAEPVVFLAGDHTADHLSTLLYDAEKARSTVGLSRPWSLFSWPPRPAFSTKWPGLGGLLGPLSCFCFLFVFATSGRPAEPSSFFHILSPIFSPTGLFFASSRLSAFVYFS